MNDQVQRWLEQARHDLESARKNQGVSLPDVAMILCQQSIEKALKALYIAQTGEFPPRIHSIERLADLTQMRPQLEPALLDIEDFYTTLRYPDFTGPLPYELVDLPDGEQAIFLTASAIDAIKKEILNIVSVSDAEQPDKDELDDQH
ncbi:MAG: HEPN domain-containing protein [Anaerolineae bacterium]|nr:HEPN domain-containing protein [Anaerolineae bacterium]